MFQRARGVFRNARNRFRHCTQLSCADLAGRHERWLKQRLLLLRQLIEAFLLAARIEHTGDLSHEEEFNEAHDCETQHHKKHYGRFLQLGALFQSDRATAHNSQTEDRNQHHGGNQAADQ